MLPVGEGDDQSSESTCQPPVAPVGAKRPRWQEPLQERNCRRHIWAGAGAGAGWEERGRCMCKYQQEMGKVSIDVLLAGLFCLAIGGIELTYTGKDQFAILQSKEKIGLFWVPLKR